MVLEPSFINKAENIKGIGIIIKWMDMGHYTIPMDEQLMKVNGKMMLFMGKVFFITKSPKKYMDFMTIRILINVKNNNLGFIMTVGS